MEVVVQYVMLFLTQNYFFKNLKHQILRALMVFSLNLGSNFSKYDITTEVIIGKSNFLFCKIHYTNSIFFLYKEHF